jgi:hypothetical protein
MTAMAQSRVRYLCLSRVLAIHCAIPQFLSTLFNHSVLYLNLAAPACTNDRTVTSTPGGGYRGRPHSALRGLASRAPTAIEESGKFDLVIAAGAAITIKLRIPAEKGDTLGDKIKLGLPR